MSAGAGKASRIAAGMRGFGSSRAIQVSQDECGRPGEGAATKTCIKPNALFALTLALAIAVLPLTVAVLALAIAILALTAVAAAAFLLLIGHFSRPFLSLSPWRG
jgi:hypothetical protein